MDKNQQTYIWAFAFLTLGVIFLIKNIRTYFKQHEKFETMQFLKAMAKYTVVGNTMAFGILFFGLGISILIFAK